jgi:hypothetical protein
MLTMGGGEEERMETVEIDIVGSRWAYRKRNDGLILI